MTPVTRRFTITLAIASAAALAAAGMGASAATPSPTIPAAKAAMAKRTPMSIKNLGYTPRALTGAQRVRVLVEFSGSTVVDKTEAARAAGQPVSSATKTRDRAAVRASQDATVRALGAAGAKVERRYTDAVSGVSATVRRSDLAAIAAIPGVIAVQPVVFYKPDNGRSNNYTGAAQAWTSPGATGSGVKVAIIDTGIDYGHTDFAGPGTTEYYNSNDHTVIEGSHPFPTVKVIAGYDFVGDTYDAESTDPAINTPVPDPDPLDCFDHGTHVAGTAAGIGVTSAGASYTGAYTQTDVNNANLRVNPGAAPQASLMAYKVFGCTGSTDSSVIVAAIDRAVADGAQVINMSLGSSYGHADGVEQSAINRAVKAGVSVVASAGNSGSANYLVGGPSTAAGAISVAAADVVPEFPGATLTSGGTSLELIDANGAAIPGGSYPVTVLSDGNGGIGLGCDAADYAGTDGHIVVAKRGDCDRVDRAKFGQGANAAAVIMVNNTDGLPPYEGDIEGVTIPFLGALESTATTLQGLDGQNASLTATTLTNPGYQLPASFTSAGPRSGDGGVKPDVIAPGVSLISAAMGTGDQALTLSGTSMAGPHAAGIVALVRGAHPTWTAQQVKDAVVGTASADPSVLAPGSTQVLAGNGMVQPLAALNAKVVLQATKAGDVGLSFGVQEGNSLERSTEVRIINLGPGDAEVDLAATAPSGVSLSVSPRHIRVRPGSREIEVRIRMTKSAVAAQPIGELPIVVGRITATTPGASTVTMPVQVIQHGRSAVQASSRSEHATSAIQVRNSGISFGAADVYEWLINDKRDRGAAYDFASLGAQSFDATGVSPVPGDRFMVLALNGYSKFWNAAENEYDVYVDSTGDGIADYVIAALDYGLVAEGASDGNLGVFVIGLNAPTMVGYEGGAPLDGSSLYLPMLASDLGLDGDHQVMRIVEVDAYPLFNEGGTDINATNATFNPFLPQRSTGGFAELNPGDRATIPVTSRKAAKGEVNSLGWMVSESNNRSGESQADLLRADR